MPGTPGNQNALRNGSRSKSPILLTLGSLGRKHVHIRNSVLKYMAALRAHTLKAHGRITPMAQEWINQAGRFEAAVRIVQKAIADDPEMSIDTKLAHLARLTAFTVERSKAVQKLRLDDSADCRGSDDPAAIYFDDPPETHDATETA